MPIQKRRYIDNAGNQERKGGGIKYGIQIRLVTYVLVAGRVAGVVDGPAAGWGDKTGAVVGTVDVLFDDSVFFKTVFILISSFFPTLFTLSSRPSAGVPPTLEAMSVNVQCRWP